MSEDRPVYDQRTQTALLDAMRKERHRAEQERFYKRRATGIGGSDVAAMLNLDPWRSAVALWKEKTNRTPPPDPAEPEPWYFERGHMLEPVARELYEKRTGYQVVQSRFRRHRVHKFMLCHPDGIIRSPDLDDGILEIKHAALGEFAKLRREGIPYHWQLQMQHNLCVTGLEWGAFAVINAERWQLLIVEVKADPAIQQSLIELEKAWWREHVVGDTAPTEETSAEHEAAPPVGGEETITRMESAEWDAALADWWAAKQLKDEVAVLESVARGTLQELMGAHGVAEGGGARVYWKQQGGRERRDWKALEKVQPLDALKVQEYLLKHHVPIPAPATLALDMGEFVSVGQPFDTFRVYHTKQEPPHEREDRSRFSEEADPQSEDEGR